MGFTLGGRQPRSILNSDQHNSNRPEHPALARIVPPLLPERRAVTGIESVQPEEPPPPGAPPDRGFKARTFVRWILSPALPTPLGREDRESRVASARVRNFWG
jgi:hypothetical protein